jgi:two-component sensor histidine kinase
MHELATNSLKYGALSAEAGTLDVSSTSHDGHIILTWMEQGGPPVTSLPERVGFGSKLVDRSMTRQLGGSIDYDWSKGGLTATLRLDRDKLSA